MRPILTSAAVFLGLLCAGASASTVVMSSATATFDQGVPYDIAKTVNGTAGDGFGWGVFGGQYANQAAVFTAAAAASTSTGLMITLPQWLDSVHHINQFRLSYTTDAVPSLGGAWTEFNPTSVAAMGGGISLASAGSNQFRIVGASNDFTSYRMMALGSFASISGFRLELFPYDNPADVDPAALGGHPNGNMVLSEFRVDTLDATTNFARYAGVTASAATWPGSPGVRITDGDLASFTHPNTGSATPFSYTVDLGATIDLSQVKIYNRNDCCPERLSNFRVSVLDATQAQVWSGDFHTDGSNSGMSGIDTITAAMGAGLFRGQFIRVTNLNGAAYSPQIAEIEAFGAVVPEPSAAALALFGLAAGLRRRR